MDSKTLYTLLENNLLIADRMAERKQEYSFDYLRGMLSGICRILSSLCYQLDDEEVIKKDLTEEEKEQYSYDKEWIADSYDVALNDIYKQMNPNIEDVEEGKTYTSHFQPWGLLTFGQEIYPVYADDPGQCDYIRIDGKNFSAGAYNFFPENDFIDQIIDYKISKKLEELKQRFKE